MSTGWLVSLAVLILLIVLAVLFLSRPVTITADPDETVTASLPDGSTVDLVGVSTLTHSPGWRLPITIAAERRVELDGEAVFTVAPEARPFVVETFNAKVVVITTRFTVTSRIETGTEVTLHEGVIAVASRGEPEELLHLEPGQSARVIGLAPPEIVEDDLLAPSP